MWRIFILIPLDMTGLKTKLHSFTHSDFCPTLLPFQFSVMITKRSIYFDFQCDTSFGKTLIYFSVPFIQNMIIVYLLKLEISTVGCPPSGLGVKHSHVRPNVLGSTLACGIVGAHC